MPPLNQQELVGLRDPILDVRWDGGNDERHLGPTGLSSDHD
jgi:hypothetical protein